MRRFFIQNKDLLLFVFVHLIVINSFVHILVIGPFLASILLVLGCGIGILLGYQNVEYEVMGYSIILLALLSYILRCLILPITYSYLEKNSENANIKKFIYNLKTNWKFRLGVLFISSLIPFTIYNNHNSSIIQLLNIHLFICSYFISYLTLYIWWDIQKLIKKYKNQTCECKKSD